MKKFLLSGTTSGVGKTTVTTAILSLLENPAPFKCGPDYIDPMFHQYICGKESINLDLYMMKEDVLKKLFNRQNGVKVLEGMMGLYDGLGHDLDNYSAAHISRVLELPVILVVDGTKVSTSIAATVKGFVEMDSRVDIKGVIINRVSEAMYYHLKEAIEKYTTIECVGYLPNDESISINERHLGLMQASEINNLNEKVVKLNAIASKTIDINRILEIAECEDSIDSFRMVIPKSNLKVGVARDLAFSFYYEDNLRLMKETGMQLIEFSPMKDTKLPDVDFLYFGGGYPEVYGRELSENTSMLQEVKNFADSGGMIYAECGGMMYLSKSIISTDEFKMVGVFDHSVKMSSKLNTKRFGYVDVEYEGLIIPAHEFHYSDVINTTNSDYGFKVVKPNRSWQCGFKYKQVLAGYPHIHFYSNIEFFKKLFKIDT